MPGLFVYDGTFEGLLTTLSLLRERDEEPDEIVGEGRGLQGSLLAETCRVKSHAGRVEEMSREICERISHRAFRHTFRAFLSDREGSEYHIYRYLHMGWGMGADVDARLGDEHVHAVHRMSRATGREAHRMHGFLRFRELKDGLYYAPMEPECDVLYLVSHHFLGRMGGQDWMIHDLLREQAALCRQGGLSYMAVPGFNPRFSEEEELYQGLWRDYFKTIAVADRLNPRLQKSCMPMKYWKILIEK
jgi:probable DNA metabolism protein